MFMNDLNSAEMSSVSPLNHDISGRFSRKGKLPEKEEKHTVLDNMLIILYIFFLISTDFILFSGSGNVALFRQSLLPIPEVSYILLGFFGVSVILVLLVRNMPLLKNLLAALTSFSFIFIFCKQFSQLNRYLTIGDFNISMGIITGIVLAAVCYVIYTYGESVVRILLTLAVAVLFFHIYFAYLKHSTNPEYLETYFNQDRFSDDTQKQKRVIYFMFPNLVSYANLAQYQDENSQNTRKIIQGFYQKNKFTVYPKAFVLDDDYLNNMVLTLNPEKKNTDGLLMDTRLLLGYWRFYNIRYEYINLKENSLYDYFSKNGYQISAYESRDFDMCHKNHAFNVNRCIEKVNQPSNLYDLNLSVPTRTKILLMEWLSSMRIFKDMSLLAAILSDFVDVNKIPMVGVNYSNLYVMNSVKIFDVLFDHIMKDEGKQAYFVFTDMPSNMYVYDEFCRLKPTHEWMDIANLPWIKENLSSKRREAYLQQTRCLYGELENFLEKLNTAGKLKNTMVIVQGISGTNDFFTEAKSDYADDFLANRSVTMAVLNMGKNKGSINKDMCTTGNIIQTYMSDRKKCQEKNDIGVHDKVITALDDRLTSLTGDIENDMTQDFTGWFAKWREYNKDRNDTAVEELFKTKKIKKKEKAEETAEEKNPATESEFEKQPEEKTENQDAEAADNSPSEPETEVSSDDTPAETETSAGTEPETSADAAGNAEIFDESDFGI